MSTDHPSKLLGTANNDVDIWVRLDPKRLDSLMYDLFHGDLHWDIQFRLNMLSLVEQFKLLTDGLSERDIDIYCQRNVMYRVNGGHASTTQEAVAKQYGISKRLVSSIASSVGLHIKDNGVKIQQGKMLTGIN